MDSGLSNLLDPEPVAHVEYLECLAARSEMQSAVGHDTVNVEHKEADGCGGFSGHEWVGVT